MGSPIGLSTDESILGKIHDLRVLEDRVQYLHAQDALLLLHNSLAIPSLMYFLRILPCFLSSQLVEFDEVVKRILSCISNTSFSKDEFIWMQASLPVRLGGLGVHSAVHLAPSVAPASFMQKAWDASGLQTTVQFLLDNASDNSSRA